MKLRKRRISILLSMLLLLSVFQPAVALDVDPDFEQIYEIGTRLLGDIEHEKELYGLSGVNFDNLYIGEYIPAYIAKETGLTPSNIRYYPVLENGEWVATLTCSKSDGIWNAQLSNTFVPELPEISANDNLKLIFDSNTCYLSKNSAIHNLTSYNAVAERVNIASSPMTLSATDGRKLINKRAVEIGKFDDNRQRRSNVPTQSTLNMAILFSKYSSRQQYDNRLVNVIGSCWAVAAKQIANYYDPTETSTVDEIYEFANIPKYEGASNPRAVAQNVLANYYNFVNPIIDISPTYSEIVSEIYAERPIYGIVAYNSSSNLTSGHGVAIRGYVQYTNSSTHIGSFSYVENEHYPAYAIAQSASNNTTLPYSYIPLGETDPTDSGYFSAFVSNIYPW